MESMEASPSTLSELSRTHSYLARPKTNTTSSFKDFFVDKLTYYEVPKVVRIRAYPLQVPNLLIQVIGTLCIAYWLCWNLHFMEFLQVTASTSFLELVPPQKNFALCHDSDLDCDDVGKYEVQNSTHCSRD